MRIRAILYDLDGTLVDSAPDIQVCLNGVLEAAGRRALGLREVHHLLGRGARVLVERAFDVTGGPVAAAAFEQAFDAFTEAYRGRPAVLTRVYPHVAETLAALAARGVRQAVVTNKPHYHAMEAVQALGLAPLLDLVLGVDDRFPHKPDPTGARWCLHTLGVPSADAVFVGDTEVDAETARNLGIPVILLRDGYSRVPVDDLGAVALLDGLHALPAALEAL